MCYILYYTILYYIILYYIVVFIYSFDFQALYTIYFYNYIILISYSAAV